MKIVTVSQLALLTEQKANESEMNLRDVGVEARETLIRLTQKMFRASASK